MTEVDYLKRTLIIIVLTFAIISMVVPAFAAAGNTIQPLYQNISSIYVGLAIDESAGTASSSGSVIAYYEVPVEVLVQLQVYKNGQWKTLMSWSNPGIGSISAGGYWTVEAGYNYRTRVTGYICNDLGIPIESEVGTKEVYYPAT